MWGGTFSRFVRRLGSCFSNAHSVSLFSVTWPRGFSEKTNVVSDCDSTSEVVFWGYSEFPFYECRLGWNVHDFSCSSSCFLLFSSLCLSFSRFSFLYRSTRSRNAFPFLAALDPETSSFSSFSCFSVSPGSFPRSSDNPPNYFSILGLFPASNRLVYIFYRPHFRFPCAGDFLC